MGSGGGTTTMTSTPDYEYNDRMAAIAEEQQAMSEELMGYYRDYQLPYEQAELESLTSLLPSQTTYEQTMNDTATQGLGIQSDYYSAMTNNGTAQSLADVQSQFLEEAKSGVSVSESMSQAQADIIKGYEGALSAQTLSDSRMGLNPNSGAAQQNAQDLAIEQAGAIAGARTQARTDTEEQNYERLASASGLSLGTTAVSSSS